MSQPPAWLGSLVDEIGNCVEAHAAMGPLGYRWSEESGAWDVIVYPTPVLLRGGEADGMIVSPGFSLDVNGLLSRFDQVADVRWSVYGHRLSPSGGQEITIEGVYAGHELFLQLLAEPPEDEEPGMELDATRSLVTGGSTDPEDVH